MKRTLIGLSLILIAVIALSACNSRTEQPVDQQKMIDQGRQVYLEYCAECHQVNGTGWSTLYPRLAGNPIVTLHDPEPVILTVKYGQGSMMSFSTKLTSEQIAAVISYIRNAWGNQAPAVSTKQIN